MDKFTKLFDIKQEDAWWIASTPTRDRDDDRVMPLGLDLANYRNNPIIAWAHDYYSPFAVIGRAAEMQVSDNDFRIKPEWREPANESDPMTIIQRLIDDGFVKALSVGFRPLEWEENEFGGYDFTKAEILEVSVVPIPANQTALRRMVKAFDGESENSDLIELECLNCGKTYEWSQSLAALVLTGKVPQVCSDCTEKLTHDLRTLQGAGPLADPEAKDADVDDGDPDDVPTDDDGATDDAPDLDEPKAEPTPADDGGEPEQDPTDPEPASGDDDEATNSADDELPPDVIDALGEALGAVGDLLTGESNHTQED